MPALTLGQGVEQIFQRVIRNSTNDKMGILSHERAGAADRPGQGDGGGQSHPGDATTPQRAPNKANLESEQSLKSLALESEAARAEGRKQSQLVGGSE